MSTRIPQSFIDELVTRTDIVELIGEHVSLKKKGREFMACCPFHNEKTPSFTVSPDKQFYHCFGCGAHGTALGFLMDYERLEFLEAVEVLAQRAGLQVPRDANAPPAQSHHKLLALLEAADAHFRSHLRKATVATGYLKDRGLSGEVAARFGLGFAPDSFDALLNALKPEASETELLSSGLVKKNVNGNLYDCFRNRVMFPIRDRRGRVIGFGGRVLDDSVPKYMNSPESPVFHKSDVLYGMYEARKTREASRRLLVVEGYMDVLALAQHGIENTVATLGTATTSQHIQQLFRYTQEIIFCFDGDRAGREAAWRAAEHTVPVFRDGLEAKFLFLPQGEDPDSLIRSRGEKIFLQYVEESVPLSSFILDKLSRDSDIRTPAGKARLAKQAKPLLSKFPDGVFKKLIFEDLEKRVGTRMHYTVDKPASAGARRFRMSSALSRPTPVRLAIAALLHESSLAATVEEVDTLHESPIAGVALLAQILSIWQQEPGLSQGALIERFRGKEEEQQLQKLMTWEPPQLKTPAQTFEAAMKWVYRKTDQARIQALIDKEESDGLNDEEKRLLRNLLHDKVS